MVKIANIDQMYKIVEYFDDNVDSNFGYIKSLNYEDSKMLVIDNQNRELYATPKAENQILERLNIKGILKDYSKFDEDIKNIEIDHAFSNGIKQVERKVKYNEKTKEYKYPNQFIYNIKDNTLYGFMGNGYRRISNLTVLKEAEKVYGSDIDSRFSYFDESHIRMNLNFKSEKIQTTAISNDRILYNFNVSNNETGGYSLKVAAGLTFLSCANGLVLDEIANKTKIVHRQPTLEAMKNKLKFALNFHLEDTSILDRIDKWSMKPPMYETLYSDETEKKLDVFLTKFNVSKEDYRRKIYKLLKLTYSDIPLNSFAIGSAVNDFASNHLDDPMEAYQLINEAYAIMNFQ